MHMCMFMSTDRYVIYGNHRDSWVHGAIDPSSGTSVMLELTRVLGRMVKQGEEISWLTDLLTNWWKLWMKCESLCLFMAGKWRPRRSIIFGSWGAEEFGLIGSAEYTEVIFNPQVIHNSRQNLNVIGNCMLSCLPFSNTTASSVNALLLTSMWI